MASLEVLEPPKAYFQITAILKDQSLGRRWKTPPSARRALLARLLAGLHRVTTRRWRWLRTIGRRRRQVQRALLPASTQQQPRPKKGRNHQGSTPSAVGA